MAHGSAKKTTNNSTTFNSKFKYYDHMMINEDAMENTKLLKVIQMN